jgi:DNA-binding MarR family transcriptional regulator
VSQAILARHLNADRMMVSQLVRALEKKGLIMRGDSTIDSRSKSVLITGKGNKLVEVLMPDVNAAETKFFAEGVNPKLKCPVLSKVEMSGSVMSEGRGRGGIDQR